MNVKKIIFSYRNHYRGLAFPIWIELFAAFVNSGTSVSVLFIALYLSNVLHLSTIATGSTITAFGLGAMIGSLSGGLLCDKFPPRHLTIITMALNGLILLIFPYLHNFYYLIFLVTCLGMTNNAFSPANRISIMNTIDEGHQYKISGIRYMVINLGMGMYVFIDGQISVIGYKYIFLYNSATILLATLFLGISRINNSVLKKTFIHNNEHQKQNGTGLNYQLFIPLYCGFLFIALIYSQLRVTYPFYLNAHYQLNERLFSNLFLINTILIATLQIPLLNALKSWNSILISGIGALLVGLGMGLLILGSSYSFAILLCIVWTIGEILYFSNLQVIIYNNAHKNHKGKHMGIYQFIIACANMIGPILGSLLYEYNQNLVWVLCVLLSILTLIFHVKIVHFTNTQTSEAEPSFIKENS